MQWNRLLFLGLLLLAGRTLAQDERPKFSVPEPKVAERRPVGPLLITELQYQLAGQEDRFPNALPELGRFFKAASAAKKVAAELSLNQLPADNPRLRQAALVYMTGSQGVLQLGDAEKIGLGEYLNNGGLLYAEDIKVSSADGGVFGAGVEGTPFDRQFKALMRDPLVLGESGARWVRMPKGHPLYRSCFDFPDGPPMGAASGGNVTDLEMLELRGRVAVIFSDLNISWYWGDTLATSRDRGLQFGVNLIVFAMTQRAAGPAIH